MRQAEEGKEFKNASGALSTVLRAGGTRPSLTKAERRPRLETEGLLPLSAAAIHRRLNFEGEPRLLQVVFVSCHL
jgi:hypothetical protein